MWCYQKPGFETLLMTALQRQQQFSQNCDLLLKTRGLIVPVHGCVLSAVSPLLSSALSSTPLLSADGRQQVDFHSLDPCTLVHIVQLLYSGQMTGEGEREKQEAISAAAKLGIEGLVEVTGRDSNRGPQREASRCTDVGVQTQPEVLESTRWRREVRDGAVFLWKEAASAGGRDVWTQTEELPVDAASPPLSPLPPNLSPHPPSSCPTVDLNSLQSFGQMDSQLVLPEIVPISIVYSESQWTHGGPETAVPVEVVGAQCVDVSVPSSLLSSSQILPCEPQAGGSAPQAAAAEELEDEHFQQFQGNIPGFINHFLNPEKGGGSGAGRAGRGRGAAAGRPRTPRGTPRGGGRGGLTQTVDVQEVSAVGRLHKLFLHRLGGRLGRSGQGGGAAGRKLRPKSRELLLNAAAAARQKNRIHSKVWELNQAGDLQLRRKSGTGSGRGSGGGGGGRGRKSTAPQRGSSARRTRRSSSPVPSPHDVDGVTTLAAPRPATPPATPPASPPFLPPAASLLHTCSLPPSAPPPLGEQSQHIDHLLEEVMMGLDILPSDCGAADPPPASGGGASLTQNQQQGHASSLREPAEEVGGAAGGDASELQQVCGGDMNNILDQFLQSFEQYVNGGETQTDGESCAEAAQQRAPSPRLQSGGTPQRIRRPPGTNEESGETPPSSSSPRPPCGAVRPRYTKPLPERWPKQYQVEKKKVKLKMAVTFHDVKIAAGGRVETQLQQIPVVKLRRSRFPPDLDCRSLRAKDGGRTEAASPAEEHSKYFLREKNLLFADRKSYPIRSRLKKMNLTESFSFFDTPEGKDWPPPTRRSHGRRCRLKRSCFNMDEKPNVILEASSPESTAKTPRRRKRKRRKSSRDPSDGVTASKRVCVDHVVDDSPKSEATESVCQSAAENVRGDRSPIRISPRETEESPAEASVEVADGEGKVSRPRPVGSARLVSVFTKLSVLPDQDDEIDVTGGSSPAPDPVTISWSESSEGEDVDIVGEE